MRLLTVSLKKITITVINKLGSRQLRLQSTN